MGKEHQKFKNSKKIEDVKSHGAEEEAAAFCPAQPTLGCKVAAVEGGCFADGKAHGNMKARNPMDLTIVIWRSYYEYIAAGFLETLASAIGSESGADIGFSFTSVVFPILVIIKLTISTVALISLIVPTATPTLPIRLPRMPITETITETKNVSWESVVEFEKGDCSLDEEIN